MSVDYGVEYATILSDGSLLLDLSPIRVYGPMVPVIRVARAWCIVLGDARESTRRTPGDLAKLRGSLLVAALEVDHVLVVDPLTVALGADNTLRASGACYVGGSQAYPLNVSIGQLGQALASVSQ
jgi:hypothetical protein